MPLTPSEILSTNELKRKVFEDRPYSPLVAEVRAAALIAMARPVDDEIVEVLCGLEPINPELKEALKTTLETHNRVARARPALVLRGLISSQVVGFLATRHDWDFRMKDRGRNYRNSMELACASVLPLMADE